MLDIFGKQYRQAKLFTNYDKKLDFINHYFSKLEFFDLKTYFLNFYFIYGE